MTQVPCFLDFAGGCHLVFTYIMHIHAPKEISLKLNITCCVFSSLNKKCLEVLISGLLIAAYKDLQSREDTRNGAWQQEGWDEVVYYTGEATSTINPEHTVVI